MKGKISPNRSLYGAPPFLTKEKNERFRGVVESSALKCIEKRKGTLILTMDERFNCLVQESMFFTMDLKIGFHPMNLRPEDIEKTAFNRNDGPIKDF